MKLHALKHTRALWSLALLSFLPLAGPVWASEQRLPVVTSEVVYAEGSFFGYGTLTAGDTLKLDLGRIDSITNALTFTKSKSSAGIPYIPLPGPLRIEKMERDAKGGLKSVRLMAGSKLSDGTDRVILDIQRFGMRGGMWIIQEQGLVQSVARLECQFPE